MNLKQTVNEYQYNMARDILLRLQAAISPDYLGLISTDGHSIIALPSPGFTDTDAVASLAAGSYAATRQLAQIVSDTEFTMMFHEGDQINVHIAQVSDRVLLVVCFKRATEIGKVRLLTNRALGALADALSRNQTEAQPLNGDKDSEEVDTDLVLDDLTDTEVNNLGSD